MTLWSLNVLLKDTPSMLAMMYKSEESAMAALASMNLSRGTAGALMCRLRDDYTRIADIPLAAIIGVTVCDVAAAMDSNVEQQILLARANADIINRSSSDPKLKLLAARGQVPGLQRVQ